MPKITFMGAGSTVFSKNVLGDCMLSKPLEDSVIALYDIDPKRLKLSPERVAECFNGIFRDMVPSSEIKGDPAGD